MPQIDEVRTAEEIGHKSKGRKFIWRECESCRKGRWVRLSSPAKKCLSCNGKEGERNWNWKGGRVTTPQGYSRIRLKRDDPFYSMADTGGYVAEHRLVMANHLQRLLLSWEVIHHKNGIKGDNRLENLELTSPEKHYLYLINRSLEGFKQVAERKEQIRLLKYLKSLLRLNPKANLEATIDLIETTDPEKWVKG